MIDKKSNLSELILAVQEKKKAKLARRNLFP